jgi:hypothetical protein
MASLVNYFEDSPVEIKANMLFWIKAGEGKYTELKDDRARFEGQLDINAMGKKIQGPFEMEMQLESTEDKGNCSVRLKFQQYDVQDEQAKYTATADTLFIEAHYKGETMELSFSKENKATNIKGSILPVMVRLEPK